MWTILRGPNLSAKAKPSSIGSPPDGNFSRRFLSRNLFPVPIHFGLNARYRFLITLLRKKVAEAALLGKIVFDRSPSCGYLGMGDISIYCFFERPNAGPDRQTRQLHRPLGLYVPSRWARGKGDE